MVNSVQDNRGYVQYLTGEGESCYRHQLLALLDFEPAEVFDKEREVHHIVHFPAESGVSFDVPGALVPVRSDFHRELHADVPGPTDGDRAPLSPPIESVLDRDDTDG